MLQWASKQQLAQRKVDSLGYLDEFELKIYYLLNSMCISSAKFEESVSLGKDWNLKRYIGCLLSSLLASAPSPPPLPGYSAYFRQSLPFSGSFYSLWSQQCKLTKDGDGTKRVDGKNLFSLHISIISRTFFATVGNKFSAWKWSGDIIGIIAVTQGRVGRVSSGRVFRLIPEARKPTTSCSYH